MRVAVWCAAALALVAAVAGSALRTSQVEGVTKIGRRLSSSTDNSSHISTRRPDEDNHTSIRPRSFRRRNENSQKDNVRKRTRSKYQETITESSATGSDTTIKPPFERNERFSSRKTFSRSRSSPNNDETITFPTTSMHAYTIRNRVRPSNRKATTLVSTAPLNIDESKIEVINSNLEDISKTSFNKNKASTQFIRRSSASYIPDNDNSKRVRSRGSSKINVTSITPDLDSSGTTNDISVSVKEPTTSRNIDFRNGRKLRYRTRLIETDSNLTGEGLKKVSNGDNKSSQNNENIASQPEFRTTQSNLVVEITEPSTTKRMKIVKRPVNRGSANLRPTVKIPKKTLADEISEDDNYPESFKALLQAKNASTHSSSQPSESLAVKASQVVYNTYTPTLESNNTDSEKSLNISRHRNKPIYEDKTENAALPSATNRSDITAIKDDLLNKKFLKRPEYKSRPNFSPRNRKNSLNISTTSRNSQNVSTEKPSYKYSRKLKLQTTILPNDQTTKQAPTSNLSKKSLVRPSYFSRQRNTTRNVPITERISFTGRKVNYEKTTVKPSSRTSYYSRFRNNRNNKIEITTSKEVSLKNNDDNFEKPVFYSTTTTSVNDNSLDTQTNDKKPEKIFVIAVTSKESQEKSMENEVMNDKNNIESNSYISTTSKYHSNYKDLNSASEEEIMVTSGPTIRNLHSKKLNYNRKEESESNDVLSIKNETYLQKISESYSKTSTPSNGITLDPDKSKSRFSSKYRATLSEKPFYRATVPTVTPSSAWLKFFVTDRELIKTVQDPDWFVGDQFFDATTESMPRQHFIQTSSFIHDSPIELVEGEENQLGPDTNYISFTQTRPTLSSADLRLSESVVKSSHIMNVEASNHSPSVTVSIFDALADILTSTPRTRLSSTTEVATKSDNKIDVKQTLNGVSNNINNVNNVRNFASPDTFMSISHDITTDTKTVQITSQTTQTNVINRMRDGKSFTPSVNEERNEILFSIPQTIPTPTTPVSARRPFAIKVLYSATATPTDMTSPISYQQSTDNPTTVHNIQSDILVSNSNVISSELTSMLSNNINYILETMDEKSRSKISVDMPKLLKSLIPRAISGLSSITSSEDIIPETTPYSLEAIKDTEVNIDLSSDKRSDLDSLQSVSSKMPVNSMVVNTESIEDDIGQTTNPTVNISGMANQSNNQINNPATESSMQTPENIDTDTTATMNIILSNLTDSMETSTEIVNSENIASLNSNSLNTNGERVVPIPFFTNSKISDFTLGEMESLVNTETTSQVPSDSSDSLTLQTDFNDIDTTDPSKVSPLQLWVLSKKASVLKMIEDLIKQHYAELAVAPSLIDNINKHNSVSVSERLSEIMNKMNTTTALDVSDIISTIMTTTPMTSIDPTIPSTSILTVSETEIPKSTTDSALLMSSTDKGEMLDNSSQLFLDTTTNEIATKVDELLTSSLPNFESTTIEGADEETTEINGESSSDLGLTPQTERDVTTQSQIDVTTLLPRKESLQNNKKSINGSSLNNVVTESVPPKKDFVIFGILPNNTVVRKDPNDDILETLTEASPYIIYGILPNNTVIRKFPNGTRVPRVMQKIDVLPISPWSLRNPYSPIHNNPAIVRPKFNPIRASTNVMTSTYTSNNEVENRLTTDTVNNQQTMISSSILNVKDSSTNMLSVFTTTNKSPAEKSTASHVLSLRTTSMLPSVDEILLNSISSATKQEMVISSMTSSTSEPRILTLDIDPETQQIRTEKPRSENMNAVFKFIPIDEVTVQPQDSNVLKLATKASTISTKSTEKNDILSLTTESNTQTSQIQMSTDIEINNSPTSTIQVSVGTPLESITDAPSSVYVRPNELNNLPVLTTVTFSTPTSTAPMTIETPTTSEIPTTTETQTTTTSFTVPMTITTSEVPKSIATEVPTTTEAEIITIKPMSNFPVTTEQPQTTTINEEAKRYQEDALLLQNLLTGRNAKKFNDLTNRTQVITQIPILTTTMPPKKNIDPDTDTQKLLQALLLTASQKPSSVNIPDIGNRQGIIKTTESTTTLRSIEEDIKQFEEDTKLLKALLQATGNNPANFKIPNLNSIVSVPSSKQVKKTTPNPTTTTNKPTTTTPSIEQDIKRFQEDTKLLQALLQATGHNQKNINDPVISSINSNIRISSKAPTTNIQLKPSTSLPYSPVYVPMTTTQTASKSFEVLPKTTTFQPILTTENYRMSTTYAPFINQRRRLPSTTASMETTGRGFQKTTEITGRQAFDGTFGVTTDAPTSSTFSVEEDVAFLKNLKSVLNTNNIEDPETALANRIIALAVEKSLNEITTAKTNEISRDEKTIINGLNRIPTTTERFTTSPTTTTSTTTTTTTTTVRPTTTLSTPSIEEDIKQFQEDTKLLQALLKATGQDPSKFKIPTIADAPTTVRLKPTFLPKPQDDLKLLSNLFASPSPLTESFNSVTLKPSKRPVFIQAPRTTPARPFGAKIAVKENINIKDEAKLLNTLIKLQGVGETTTQMPKLTVTGQTSNEALKLLQRTKQPGSMVSEATQAPMSLSTEYGKSQDALLAALLKEQGFGPSTASSLDEQLRLAALLNQVVVTPKARRITTPPPPPPAPRRPILDGLAWLWQQWRETAPGPGGTRTNRRPAPSLVPSASSSVTSSRVNWFGSGPFVGNSDERPATSNRVPLEPPAVVAEQAPGPGRGQLVSAAINVTRAFSQFLGAAIQGAAQTVQSVIRAGQRAASDVYVNGSG